ncbi:MAG: Cyanobacterial phytochrome [Verrucomicrobiales bacterium]|nr:Cyanobacterial phytochrome [Verrucomicrobiales bacterium]
MISLENIPIRRKLTAAIMFTSGIVLVLACIAFTIYEFVAFRKDITRNVGTLAKVIAANSTGALAFQNEKDATEVLSALKAERHIAAAALYDKDGVLFARYPTNALPRFFPVTPGPDGHLFDGDNLIFSEPVAAEKRLGTLYLKSDLEALYDRTLLYAGITVLFLAGSFVVAFAISTSLQGRIAKPILELAETAQRVSHEKDYSVRARIGGKDELGQLARSFNDMLTQIHERDLALSEKEERLRLALQSARTGVWDWNLITGKLTWDEFLYPMFGVEKEKFRGTIEHVNELAHPEDRAWLTEALARSIAEKTDFFAEFRIVTGNGTARYIASRGRAFYDSNGKPVRMIGVSADITERKRTEQALRESEEKYRRLSAELEERVEKRTLELATLNQELEAFTYSVSHDLRAPLRHINAYAQLIQEEIAPNITPTVKGHIKRIVDGAKNMGQLIDDLLNLARVGKLELTREKILLRPMIEDVISLLKPDTENRQIEWQIGNLRWAECDSGLLKQVFVNLLSNAVKYTRLREKTVIKVDHTVINGEPVIFVRDNGVGFDMRYASKLFGVFQRLHLAEQFEGTGVGLATVARIIQKHHGKIWAEAELDKGATFYFTIPGLHS